MYNLLVIEDVADVNAMLCEFFTHAGYSVLSAKDEAEGLANVSFELKKGRIYGLIGANGAGKTTIMKCITGLTFPTSGEMTLFGETMY